jgi:hypothetical protein
MYDKNDLIHVINIYMNDDALLIDELCEKYRQRIKTRLNDLALDRGVSQEKLDEVFEILDSKPELRVKLLSVPGAIRVGKDPKAKPKKKKQTSSNFPGLKWHLHKEGLSWTSDIKYGTSEGYIKNIETGIVIACIKNSYPCVLEHDDILYLTDLGIASKIVNFTNDQ